MKLISSFIAIFMISSAVYCAELWNYKCETPDCNFSGGFAIGSFFTRSCIAGYCSTCKQFVSIEWKQHSEKAPEKLGSVWDYKTGKSTDIYPCPKCKSPVLEISSKSLYDCSSEYDKKKNKDDNWSTSFRVYCPHCGKENLYIGMTAYAD